MTTSPSQPHLLKRILVPLDGSVFATSVLPYVSALGGPDTEFILLQVMPAATPIRNLLGQEVVPAEEVARWDEERAQRELEADAEQLRRPARSVKTRIAAGDPATEILRVIEAEGVNLVALASHGRGAVGRLAFGSVADRLTRYSPIPVLIIRGQTEPERDAIARREAVLRRLVVPLDSSALAEQALPVARDLAQTLHLPVQLLTVLDPSTMASPALAYAAAFLQQFEDEMVAGMRRNAEAYLSATVSDLGAAGISAGWDIRQGAIADAIASATRPGDVLVMTSHGRGGITRWLIGSVAERLVRIAPVPVMLVPAPGRGRRDPSH